jgi:HlyD family secretion protein
MSAKRIFVILGLLGVVAAGFFGWRSYSRGSTPTMTFETAKVEKGPIQAKVTATGALNPRTLVLVSSQVSGRVVEVHADWNAEVKKGQLLLRLDPQPFQAALTQAQANLAVARANRDKAIVAALDADKQLTRTQALSERNIIAATELDAAVTTRDSAKASVSAAKAQVQQAEAAVTQAKLNLELTEIMAPLDGVVISRAVDVGNTVAASLQAPTLFTIAGDLAKMQIDTSVSEGDVGRLAAGMKATFTVDAFPGEAFHGEVRQVRNAATTVSNVVTYNVVIDVENPSGKLRPGMTANVTFIVAEVTEALKLPNSVLRFRPSQEQLAVLRGPREEGEERPARTGGGQRQRSADEKTVWKLVDGTPTPVRITIGLTDGTATEIKEGELVAGDVIVTEIVGGPKPTAPAGGAGAGGGRGGNRMPRGPF